MERQHARQDFAEMWGDTPECRLDDEVNGSNFSKILNGNRDQVIYYLKEGLLILCITLFLFFI